MIQTSTIYPKLGASDIGLQGLRFRTLVSVDAVTSPINPEVIGTIDATGYALDSAAGTIRRAPGLDPVWARVVFEWEDAPTQEQAAAAQATADYLASLPDFRDNLAAALTRLHTGVGSIQAQCDAIATSATTGQVPTIVTALQTAVIRTNTIANCAADCQTAIRNIGTVLESMRTAHNLEALAIRDEAQFLRRTIQVLASSLGIPLA